MLSYLFICRFGNREDVKRVYSPSIGCSETFFFSKLMLYKFPHQRKEVIPEILKLLQILKSSKLFSLYRKKKFSPRRPFLPLKHITKDGDRSGLIVKITISGATGAK